jgi:hypothetical protein
MLPLIQNGNGTEEIHDMSSPSGRQFCAICAWRENCAKKFCVPDGGAHCPDFCRDISLKEPVEKKDDEETST